MVMDAFLSSTCSSGGQLGRESYSVALGAAYASGKSESLRGILRAQQTEPPTLSPGCPTKGTQAMTATAWIALAAGAGGIAIGPVLDVAIEAAVSRRLRVNPLPVGRVAKQWPRAWRSGALSFMAGGLEVWAALRFGPNWTLLPVAFFFVGLVALAWSDGRYFLLPRLIQHPTTLISGILLVVAAGATGEWHRLGIAAACGGVAFTTFFVMNFINPKGMAFGDVRLAGTIGLVVGWLGVRRTFTAFLIAGV